MRPLNETSPKVLDRILNYRLVLYSGMKGLVQDLGLMHLHFVLGIEHLKTWATKARMTYDGNERH